MKAGDKVRLKSDPSRIGVLSGQEQEWAGKRRLEVRLFDGTDQFFLENSLELVISDDSNPFNLFRNGKYGRLRDLRGSLTYYRLSGKLANLIYSMDTTNTDFYAYQFKPVLAFLDSPNHGLLIADEVGLGKTIEAGLIWTELRSRFDARRLLVICPAILREKWQSELSRRFGIDAEICSASELVSKIERHKKGDLSNFAVITSLQGIRPPRGWDDGEKKNKSAAAELAQLFDRLEDEDPIFDLTIIDEAHYLRNPESQTSKLGSLIRPLTDGLVMLSATPIQLKNDDLYHQVKYLDEATFSNAYAFEKALESSRPLLELRDEILKGKSTTKFMQEKLREAQLYPQLKNSLQIKHLLDNPPSSKDLTNHVLRAELAETVDRINPLNHVISRTRKRDVHERRVLRDVQALRVTMSDVEQSFYCDVTQRVRNYCKQYNLHEGFLLTIPQRQMTSSMPAACRAWLKKEEAIEEDFLLEGLAVDFDTELKKPNLGPLTLELLDIAKELGDFNALKMNDSKFNLLIKNLRKYWAKYPEKKVIIFSFYKETLAYLNERFLDEKIIGIILQGGMDKQQIIAKFESPDGPKLLLASEVVSEGVDLQFSSLLINYDLPWNPQRIEQRIGRIDRIGQKENKINIWNIFHENTIDDRVYTRLLERLDIFRNALGSIESVLGQEIRRMTYHLFSHDLSEKQELNVIEQTSQAFANRQLQEQKLEEQASYLVAHGDYIQNKVKAARELKRFVTGNDIYNYVKDFFDDEFPGCRFERLDHEKLVYKVDLSGDARFEFGDFLQRSKLQGKTRIAQATEKMRFLFENRVVDSKSKEEIVSQFHPLIRYISEYYRSKGVRKYFSVNAVEVCGVDLPNIVPGIYIFAVERWSVKVALRDIEQLSYKVITLDGNELDTDDSELIVNTAIHDGQDWLSANNEVDSVKAEELFSTCIDSLENKYQMYVGTMIRENCDRLNFQRTNIEIQFAKKESEWIERIRKMRNEGKERGARLQEAKLIKHRTRAEEILLSIRKSEKPVHEKTLVSSGLIRIK